MSDKKREVISQLNRWSVPELREKLLEVSKKLGEANRQIQQKDRLIADFTAGKEKTKREAEAIISSAQARAREIERATERSEAELHQKRAEVDAEVSRKLANAHAEADSIVEAQLNQAKSEIRALEARRDTVKRNTINLNTAIIERYDDLIEEISGQMSRFRDMKESLSTFNAEIESEDFKKFDIADYVTTTESKAATKTEKPKSASHRAASTGIASSILDVDNDDIEIGDEDLADLARVLYSDPDPDEDELDDEIIDDGTDIMDDDDLQFLTEEFDLDFDLSGVMEDDEPSTAPVATAPVASPAAVMGNIDDIIDDDLDDDLFNDGTSKSFTASFMAVRPTIDDDDDLSEVDIDSIFDDDDFDFGVTDVADAIPAPAPAADPSINMPVRRNRRNGTSRGGAWLS